MTVKWENIKKGQLLRNISARVVFSIPNTLELSSKETLNGLFPPINADKVNLIQFVKSCSTRRRRVKRLLLDIVKEDFGFVQREEVPGGTTYKEAWPFCSVSYKKFYKCREITSQARFAHAY